VTTIAWTELAAGAAIIIALVGMRLCWRAPRYRMSIEERAKDGIITEDCARRKIAFMQWFGPVIALAGCALLAAVILR
jgi:hypothetical protein